MARSKALGRSPEAVAAQNSMPVYPTCGLRMRVREAGEERRGGKSWDGLGWGFGVIGDGNAVLGNGWRWREVRVGVGWVG